MRREGHVLKSNKNNSEAIEKGIMAILYHYSSTEENPQHQGNGVHTHRPVKDPIPNALKKIVLSVFDKLR